MEENFDNSPAVAAFSEGAATFLVEDPALRVTLEEKAEWERTGLSPADKALREVFDREDAEGRHGEPSAIGDLFRNRVATGNGQFVDVGVPYTSDAVCPPKTNTAAASSNGPWATPDMFRWVDDMDSGRPPIAFNADGRPTRIRTAAQILELMDRLDAGEPVDQFDVIMIHDATGKQTGVTTMAGLESVLHGMNDAELPKPCLCCENPVAG